jgi:hypothetical protein
LTTGIRQFLDGVFHIRGTQELSFLHIHRPTMDVDPCNRIGMITVLNKRSARDYLPGETSPDFEIHNFFDLLDFLRDRFGVDIKS